uniref:Uncharacterized protein n=1 Tax=Clytia hemisphaerica TaxID=252671 RepID=A0A7M5UHV8_9CNID
MTSKITIQKIFIFIFSVIFCICGGVKSCLKAKPPNRHGVEPIKFLQNEIRLTKDNRVGYIQRLSTEWKISFKLKYVAHNPPSYGTNTLFLKGTFNYPAIQGYAGTSKLDITHRISSGINNRFVSDILTLNKYYSIELEQRYISNGNYKYSIKIDGIEKHSVINNDAQQIYNVEIYASHHTRIPSPADMKDLEITNFL